MKEDKCPVCGNEEYWYFGVGSVLLCACRNCGTVKATKKYMKETQERFDKALKMMSEEVVAVGKAITKKEG